MGNVLAQPTEYDIYAREVMYNLPTTTDSHKFEIKPSSRNLAGNGVFALEDISAGTILPLDNAEFINDLAYNVDATPTYSIDSVKEHTNILMLVRKASPAEFMFNNVSFIPLAIKVIKDIKAGEELSKCYGPSFWKDYDFWHIRPDCKWRDTSLDEDLPDEFIFIDTCRLKLEINYCEDLYGKKVGDKYYYQIHRNRREKVIDDVSLPNNVIMPIGHFIKDSGYRTKFLHDTYEPEPMPKGCIGRINNDGSFEKNTDKGPRAEVVDVIYGPPHQIKSVNPQHASLERDSLTFRIINNPNISKRGIEVHDYKSQKEIHSTILCEPIDNDIDFNQYVDGVVADINAGKYNQYITA